MDRQHRTCQVVRPQATYEGKQGLDYFAGVSSETVGSTGLCMHMVTIPPGVRANAHLHENHETAIYMLRGTAEMWYGDGLREHLTVKEGEYLYIPAGVPHLPYNPSQTETAIGVLARTDPNEQESVVLLPALNDVGLVPSR
jgi:uncharacterized RmlC-like cupin family protein